MPAKKHTPGVRYGIRSTVLSLHAVLMPYTMIDEASGYQSA